MDDFDNAIVRVRADTAGFAREVASLRATLEDGLGAGAERAAGRIEGALSRAVRTGKLGFEELGTLALRVLADIAAASLGNGSSVTSLLGSPGRATGGPVSPGRAYVVGERGPELFVPTASGQIAAGNAAQREVKVSITVNAAAGSSPELLQRSARQVGRAVRAALREE
jgi:phage-related minor tail protein